METISLYDAISEMRFITSQGGYFTFMHATYNRDKRTTGGMREVKRAQLRPAPSGADITNADYKLFYYDDIFRENRNCWQMLIMFFNGKKVVLT